MIKLVRSLWIVVIGFCTSAPALAQQGEGADILSPFLPTMTADCDAVPVPELLKYQNCTGPYVTRLKDFIAEQAFAQQLAITQRREKLWEWFLGPPVVECEVIPEAEAVKFAYLCDDDRTDDNAMGLSNAMGRMQVVQMQRNAVAASIEALEERRAALLEREQTLDARLPPEDVMAVTLVMSALEVALERRALVERMSSVLTFEADNVPALVAIRFAALAPGSQVRSSAAADAPVVHTVQQSAFETVIHLMADGDTEFELVVQAEVGLGYVQGSQIEAR